MVETADERSRELAAVKELEKACREAYAISAPPVSAETLHAMAETLFDGLPLEEAARLLPGEGAESAESLDTALRILKEYGSWVAKTVKDRPKVSYMFASESPQLQLFATPRKEKKGVIVIPLGYERDRKENGGSGGDGADALVNLLFHRPDSAQAGRYVHSLSRKTSRPLSFDVLSAVWGFSCRGRLPGLRNVGGDARFLELSLEAYRLLETYRSDAITALRKLMSIDPSEFELILESITRCFWLAERDLSRVKAAAEAGDERRTAAALAGLRQAVRSSIIVPPSRVGALNAGQVRRIGLVSGLLDEETGLQEEREIRARLKKMGFGRDADRLTQDGMSAVRSGSVERFWEAMEARSAGDLTWPDILADSIG